MTPFMGFADGKSARVSLPAVFFTELLPAMDHIGELKISLILFRLLEGQEAPVRYVTLRDLLDDPEVNRSFGVSSDLVTETIQDALQRACKRGIFIMGHSGTDTLYLLNTPRSRAALIALQKGSWLPQNESQPVSVVKDGRPNIFELYEQNIGPLTPILAQTLEEAEKEFPVDWIEEALTIAVKKNIRNWNYAEAILRSWKEKGRSEENQRDSKENPRRYIEGDLADYIKH
jgi:DNA replication protein